MLVSRTTFLADSRSRSSPRTAALATLSRSRKLWRGSPARAIGSCSMSAGKSSRTSTSNPSSRSRPLEWRRWESDGVASSGMCRSTCSRRSAPSPFLSAQSRVPI
eukprot:Amastigsp_a851831_11.p3 type:complete len:105 gc:universal Amastigsp_a851831_11:235-549(+)